MHSWIQIEFTNIIGQFKYKNVHKLIHDMIFKVFFKHFIIYILNNNNFLNTILNKI